MSLLERNGSENDICSHLLRHKKEEKLEKVESSVDDVRNQVNKGGSFNI